MLKKNWFTFFLASLFIHFSFVLFLYFSKNVTPKSENKTTVEINYIAPQIPSKENRQVIDQTNKSLNDEVPDKSAYLGKYNQKVEKEVQAQRSGDYINSADKGQDIASKKRESQHTKFTKADKKSNPTKHAHKTVKLYDLAPKYNFSDTEEELHKEQLQSGLSSAQSDHLDNVAVGIETVLNSREFVYHTYFTRIKDRLRTVWGRKVREKVEKLAKRGRYIASDQDRVTKLIIILSETGQLETIRLMGRSGVIDLDDAAIDAFKAAAPFPNPPKGMVEADGKVRLTWDFVLEA